MLTRYDNNPIFTPNEDNKWEAEAVLNPSILKKGSTYYMFYRAISSKVVYKEQEMLLSTIGLAKSKDGLNFTDRKQFITPMYYWEQFGCEDPRATVFEDRTYIFYTALSNYPHNADGIKTAVAITDDFEKIEEKHLVTPFNAKAMCLFPERINGKVTILLSVDTDRPPSSIAIAQADNIEDFWDNKYWQEWYKDKDKYSLNLEKYGNDHVEVGAVPVKTNDGWLLVYSHIQNYFTPPPLFGVEAVLLEDKDPLKIKARTADPILVPVEEYERFGLVPNVVFPTSLILENGEAHLYYGAADTVIARASESVNKLLKQIKSKKPKKNTKKISLKRYSENPIIKITDNEFENEATYNPTALKLDNEVYILYRAQSKDNTSTIGLAISRDGFKIEERLNEPIYVPREDFETKDKENAFSGCEDPRATIIGDRIYICYTAYSGVGTTKIALTSITKEDFLARNWNWDKPKVISDPTRNNKNACLLDEKIDGKYVFLHRLGGCIWVDRKDDLNFENDYVGGTIFVYPRKEMWDSRKIGIAGPPMKIKDGWLLIYHGLSLHDDKYRLGAMMFDKKLEKVISRLDYPLIEPEMDYEMQGIRHDTIFSCGQVIIDGDIFVYYGGGDKNVGVATVSLSKLLNELSKSNTDYE